MMLPFRKAVYTLQLVLTRESSSSQNQIKVLLSEQLLKSCLVYLECIYWTVTSEFGR